MATPAPGCGNLLAMHHLSEEQLAELASRLRSERERLERSLHEREAPLAGDDPGDIQDAAAEHAGRTQASMLMRREQNRLQAVQAALARMDAGRYGICEESDEPIPVGRLRLDPAVRLTVEAQEELELLDGERGAVEDDEAY